jgi:hypothetical protein
MIVFNNIQSEDFDEFKKMVMAAEKENISSQQ